MESLTGRLAGLSPERRELLEALLRKKRTQSAASTIPPRPGTGEPVPLSFSQERLWLIDQLEPGNPAYNIPLAVRLTGELAPGLLVRIFFEIVRRHEALRTTFTVHEGHPAQVIAEPGAPPELPVVDLSHLPEAEREEQARRLARAEARRPFDLQRGPLLRLALVRLGARDHLLLATLHHIVSDGWSQGVLLREVSALAEAFRRGLPSPLPELPVQYADFAVWQRGWMRGDVLAAQLDSWEKRLAGAPRALELPTDRPRPAAQTHNGALLPVALPPALSDAVRELGRREGATPFMFLLAAWALLLGRHAGQEDVLVGTPVAGRNREEVEGLIGFFVNTVVLRTRWSPSPSPPFRELLGRVRAAALEAFGDQDIPFERLVGELVPERDLSRSPLFQVLFALQNAPRGALTVPGLALAPVEVDAGLAKLDLSLVLHESPGGIAGRLEHNTDLFDRTTAERLLAHFLELLGQVVADPERRVQEVPLLSEGERHQVLLEWAGSGEADLDLGDGRLQGLFLARAARAPEAVALVAGGSALTYGELAARVDRLARHLVRQGVGPEVTVGICLEDPTEIVTAMLAVLEAGGAFLPLDPSHPAERRRFILDSARTALVLTRLDALLERPAGETPALACLPENLAYVIYTSGTTGQPKGVAVTRATLASMLSWGIARFGLGPHTRALQNLAPWFDFGVFEILTTLLAGGTLHLPGERADTSRHGAYIREHRINTLCSTPTFFREVLAAGGPLPGLEVLHLGGEALHPAVVQRIFAAVGERCRLFNGYGPTEATINCALFEVGREALHADAVPIGRATARHELHVLDRGGEPAGIGVPGELCVGGAGLARGYLNRPGLTAERFLPDPFGATPGARLYRTGDLVRRLPAGNLEFLGRIDQQVKLRGLRIEPGEIEQVLAAHPRVREVVVVAREDHPGDPRLVAYVVCAAPGTEDSAPSVDELRRLAGARLPTALVPSAIVFLDALPRTGTGKLDRKALPAPDPGSSAARQIIAPRTRTERALVEIWKELLGLEQVGVEDDFFQLGGHSLTGAQVLARVRTTFRIDLPLREVFRHPTVASLAGLIDAQAPAVEPIVAPAVALEDTARNRVAGLSQNRRDLLEALLQKKRALAAAAAPTVAPRTIPRREGDGPWPLSYSQERLWLIDQLEPGTPAYNIPLAMRLTGELSFVLLERIFAEIVRRHEALRTTFAVRDGWPVQVIAGPDAPAAQPELPVLDLSGLPAGEREALALRLAREEAGRSFDLRRGPLLRLSLVRLAPREHLLLVTMHHIVSDGWSMRVLQHEIAALQAACSTGRPSPLPELPVQYPDFAVWQRGWLQGEALAAQLDWWRRELAEAPGTINLPADRPRTPLHSHEGGFLLLTLPARLVSGLRELGRRHGVTLFMAALAVWQTLLHRVGHQEDVLVGTPVANRGRLETEGLIGFFVNTLVLRGRFATGGLTFRGVLEQTREAVLGAFDHQDIPFDRLVEELVPERNLAVSPLFQVFFSLQTAASGPLALPGLTLEPVQAYSGQAQFELSLDLIDAGGELRASLEFSRALFDEATARRLLASFLRLLEGGVAAPQERIAELPLLGAGELHQILCEWNENPALPPGRESILPAFEQWAARTPDAPALSQEERRFTYRELDRWANRLAWRLRRLGVGPETRVAALVERSPELIAAFLGILKAGGAYVPLDPAYPPDRLAFMLESSGATLLLTLSRQARNLPEGAPPALFLDAPEGLAGEPDEAPPRDLSPAHLAYVLYTSGSTGRPKGVMVPHGTLARFTEAIQTAYRLGPGDRMLQFCSISFDTSVEEIVTPLTTGAELVLRTDATIASVAAFLEYCQTYGVTAFSLPTAYWHEIVAKVESEHLELPDCMRLMVIGGERALLERVVAWRRLTPGRPQLINSYGLTETTIVSALTDLAEPSAAEARGEVSFGRAIPATGLYVLDRGHEPVPIGVLGELLIGGELVTRGYQGRPDLTAERFVPHPFAAEPGARLYRTGDIVRAIPNGELEFSGRGDRQIKIRGYRIEVEEIEARLLHHPEVESAVVAVREDRPGDKRIVAYLVPRPSTLPDPVGLRIFLRETLPDHMIPAAFVALEALPLSPNGKIDRRALPPPEKAIALEESQAASAAPSDPVEELIAGIWAEVLGRRRVGVHDDFFSLGGQSLLATQVMSRLRSVLGVEIPLRQLFEAPTVAELARLVRTAREGVHPPIERVPRDGALPLSFAQQRLWLIDQLEPGSPAYNIPSAVRLTGEVSPVLLERIFREIVHRHEALRTTFDARQGKPAQVVHADPAPRLPIADLSLLPAAAREAEALRLAAGEALRPFDLCTGPLLRLALLRLDERDHALLVTLHHIVSDGWSMGVLLREVAALHAAFSQGQPSPLPELPVQYADFAVWQRGWLQGEVLEAQLASSRRRLAGAPHVLELPTDRTRPAVQTHRGAVRSQTLPPTLSAALHQLCRQESVTPFMALLAAWGVLLGRHTGQDDLLVGSPIAGRNRREVEELIGFFVNTLVLRIGLAGQEIPFRALLGRVRAESLEAFSHQDLPFERLVEELVPERDLSRSPLFQVLFVLQNTPEGRLSVPGLTLAPLAFESGIAKFDLTLSLGEEPEGLSAALEHNADLFDGSTAARLLDRFAALLEAAVASPGTALADLPLLRPAERQQLLEWGGTAGEPATETLHGRFELQARRNPDAVAVVCEGSHLTYGELNRRANQVAWRLRASGVGPDERVGLCAERSLDLLVGLVGILKAGGAYVPLDPRYPVERLVSTLEDAGCRLLVGTEEAVAALPAGPERVLLDAHAGRLAALPEDDPPPCAEGASLAYVIYTSGSTGRPKGSLLTHGHVVRLFDATDAWFGFGGRDVWTLFHSYAFDFSVWEIWGALLYGGRLVVVPYLVSRSPEDFHRLLVREGVTVLNQTPSAFAQLQRVDEEPERAGALRDLRLVIFGGEALDPASLASWFDRHGDERPLLVNMYGITETTVHVTYRPVRRADTRGRRSAIGVPIQDLAVHVLDPWLRPAPIGVPGEMVVAGAGLARGYLHRPDLTAERFVPDPVSGRPGARVYRSGDLARYLPDGDLDYLGRIDHQVKIRGFRIEPGEIEATLAGHPDVRECLVLARRDTPGNPGDVRLVAYVVPRGGREARPEELREHLRARLPEHMVPSAFVLLEAFPLTPNGKVDRKALPAPERTRSGSRELVAPRTRTEEGLAEIWEELLGLEQVGVEDGFFESGGHSLLATQVLARVRTTFGVDLPLREIFLHPTVAALAARIDALAPAKEGDGAPRSRRELLEALIQKRRSRAAAAPAAPVTPAVLLTVPRRTTPGPWSLSFAQERLWLIDQLDPGSAAYNMPMGLRLAGELSAPLLERVFAEIVRRHEALRTTFAVRAGQPVQVIAPEDALPEMRVLDLTHLPPAEREAEALARARAEAGRPFDLGRGPLLRLLLARLAPCEHVLLVTMHHIVSDGWSLGVMLREITALHEAFSQGLPSPLPELPVQYADFAVWQRGWLEGRVLEEQLAFWRQRLAGAPRVLDLPTDRPRPAVQTSRGASRLLALSPALSEAIGELCRRERATPFMVLLTAWGLLLGRHAGQEDLLVGTPIAGRSHQELEGLIGFFVNTLVLRVELTGGPDFGAAVGRVRDEALEAFSHQDLPFERLVEALVPQRDLARSPLFQVVFALQNVPAGRPALPGLGLTPLELESGQAKYDLTLTLAGTPAGFAGALEFNTDLFDGSTAARLLARFEGLLETVARDPAVSVASVPLLLPAERQQALVEWNDTWTSYPREACLAELFEEVARQRPGAPALLTVDGEAWSYRRLDEESNRLARRLRALGAGTETAVGIAMERSPELILGILAILKAGGIYVPLDAGYPDERLGFMLEDTGARLVLVQEATRERLGWMAPVLALEDPEWRREVAEPLGVRVPAASLACVLYTSGSTGRPKGVGIPQQGVARLVRDTNYVALGPGDRSLHTSSISFDAATYEIWGALLNGAALVLVPREIVLSPAGLARVMREQGVNSAFLTAALFARMARELPEAFADLRDLLTGGEAMDPVAARNLLAGRPPRRLLNLYGPTENTTLATWHPVAEVPDGAAGVPIGRAVANTSLQVLDEGQLPVPPGVAGELCIGGDGLARGYLNRPELTAERFIPNPWEPGGRLYRTGDLVRQRPDGALEFLGRIDQQVKIRGFRIEPGEIEIALAAHPDVRECAVIARRDEARAGSLRLVAYAAGKPDRTLRAADLRQFLQERLPDYMIPAAFVVLDALPVTLNGKLDRRALPEPESAEVAHAGGPEPAAPSDPVEELVAAIWTEVLGHGRFGVHDDFFALGGHSLLATQVVSRIREVLGAELPLRQLFEAPTVAGLARAVREASAAVLAGAPPIVPVPRDRGLPLSFAQQRLWLLDQLEPGSSAYNVPLALRLTGELSAGLLERVFAEIARRHEVLRTRFETREGGPVQVIAPPGGTLPLPLIDLSADPGGEARAPALVLEEARRPFDLRSGPLLRLLLVRLAEREHILLVTLHHIVSDGWSLGVLLREVGTLHAAFAQGLPSPLPDLPVQYADFAVWQRSWLQGEVLEAQLDFWKRRLAGAPAVLELPLDRPRPAVQTFRGASAPVVLPAALSEAVSHLCRRQGVTPFMALLAAWAVLLGRHAGQDDVLLGSPIAGRTRREIEGLIGFFINTLVLRSDLSGNPGFGALLEQVRRTALDAFAHQDLPFERIVEETVAERNLAVSPLFQVMFALQNAPLGELTLPGLAFSPVDVETGLAKFDLSLILQEGPAGFAGTLEHNADLFDGSTAERLGARFAALLAGAVADPGQPIADLPLLLPAERRQLLEWNDTGAAPAPALCLHELFFAQAARTPEAVALVHGAERLTYAELAARAGGIARLLRELEAGPETRVAVCLERSPGLIASLLGVLAAGAAYVPVDPAYPVERRALMLQDSGAAVLVTRGPLAADLPATGARLLDLDAVEIPAARPPRDPGVRPGHLAYLIYTSGSTGRPKAVAIEHRSAVALAGWAREEFSDQELAGVLAATSVCFDLSVFEIFVPLAFGGKVLLAENALELPALPAAAEVRLLNTVPSAAAELVRSGGLPASVRTVCLAGEPLPAALAARLHATGTVQRLLNLYGPSEDTTYSTGALVPPADDRAPAIGRPIRGTRAHVVDRHGTPVPPGVAGELWLAGAGLARGYLGRPELTAERFTPDPFGEPGDRVYRTGDLVRFRPDGELDFLGRIDHQVKVRGFRIELGEIETVLGSHPGVRECVVLVRENTLVAYVVGSGEISGLRSFLGRRLPDYMVPSVFMLLETLPLSPNGKVDRKALPAPQATRAVDAGADAPSDPVEELLAGIWTEVLGIERVGVHENFFALGGHSLLATQVASRIRGLLGTELPLRQLFEAPTLADLARAVREAGSAVQAPPIVPVPRGRDLPLSFAQQRLWLIDQIDPGSPAYNMPLALRLTGALSTGLLAHIFAEIVRRHEVLRTTFEAREGGPVQVIAPPGPTVPLPLVDLSADPEREARARALALEEALRPFDLRRGPLLRLLLVRLAEQEHILLVTLHHIVSDAWSLGVLLREVAALHEGSPLPDLPVQYADFAVWQRSWLQGEVLEAQLDHWKRRLTGAPALLELPLDRPRPAMQTFRGDARSVALEPALSDAVGRLCRARGVTPFMALLAAWAVLLGRHAGQDDVLLGSPIAGRNRREIEGLIGFFVNTLVLRSDLSGNPSFGALLERVRRTALDAFSHQDLSFERIVEEVVVERNLAVSPLFQVMFALQNAPLGELALPGMALAPVDVDAGVAKFDLSLTFQESPAGFAGTLDYNVDLFDGTTADRMLRQIRELLAGAVRDPERRLLELPLLAESERHQVLIEWAASRFEPAEDGLVQDLFRARAARTPGAVALVAGGSATTYGDLAARAGRLARHLAARGVGPEVTVGICLEAPAEIVTAMLAVLEAGGTFLPMDPAYPDERRSFILEDARAALVLDRLPDSLPTEEAAAAASLASCLPENLADESIPSPRPQGAPSLASCLPENLAYVIYTSGTTGQPKGVGIAHQTLVPLLSWGIDTFGLGGHTRVLQNLAPWFDFGVFEILTTLLAGGTLYIPDERKDASRHGAFLRENRINTLHSTPSFFREVLATGGALPDLEVLHLGGEALFQGAVQRMFDAVGERCHLYNGYGPTEATINCALFDAGTPAERRDRPASNTAAALPIGRATARHALYVRDRNGDPLELAGIGVPGELCVGGEGLARGYLNRPGLTAERFQPDPFSATPGARLYRTGDLVRSLPGGDLEFLGRIDQQVKLRGLRIELGEIETVLAAHPGVSEVVALVREDRPGDQRLVAYVVSAADSQPAPEELRQLAGTRLPAGLVPSALVFLDTFPRTATGKVDRKALPAPVQVRGPEHLAPRDALELELVRIWEEALGTAPVGVRDDFFALGGHSLLAVQVTSRIESRLGRALPLATLLRHPTVERLAAVLREDAGPLRRETLVELTPGSGRPLFLVHPVGGEVFCYVPLARHLADRPVYGLQATADAGSIEEMAERYLRHVREAQPEGPYLLGGWSLGGTVAWEMARQLEAQGQSVERVILIDSYAPGERWNEPLGERELVASFAVDLARLLGVRGLPIPESFEALVATAEEAGLLPPGFGRAELERRFALFAANSRAVAAYRGGRCSAPLLLIRAAEPAGAEPDRGWEAVAGHPIEVCELPGDHYSLLQEPTAAALASLLR